MNGSEDNTQFCESLVGQSDTLKASLHMKKKVLFFVSPSQFVNKPYFKASSHGADLLSYGIDRNKYEVSYYDLDAYIIKNGFNNFDNFLEENIIKDYDYVLCSLNFSWPFGFYPKNKVSNKIKIKFTNIIKNKLKTDFLVLSKIINYLHESFYSESHLKESFIEDIYTFLNLKIDFCLSITYSILKKLKQKNKDTLILCGGSGWDRVNLEYFDNLLDLIYYGEFPSDKINDLLEGNVYLGEKNKIISNNNYFKKTYGNKKYFNIPFPEKNIFKNISDLKISYKDIFSSFNYSVPKEYENKFIQTASFSFMSGCPGKCSFCGDGTKNLKVLPDKKIKDIIKYSINELGYNSFMFFNDNLTINRKFVEDFCNWIIKENIKIFWSDSCKLSITDLDFFKMLYESGARYICFGSEVIDSKMLKYINKGITVEQIKEGLINSHKAGIWNNSCFIFGLPYETPEVIDSTLSFIESYNEYIDDFSLNMFRIDKTSPFYKYPQEFNIKIENNSWHEKDKDFTKIMKESEINSIYIYNKTKNLPICRDMNQHVLFALYDIFKDKEKVKEWINKNVSHIPENFFFDIFL